MSFARKFKRQQLKRNPKMRKIIFPHEPYSFDMDRGTYDFTGDGRLGLFELLWAAVKNSPEGMFDRNNQTIGKKLDKKDRKVIRSLMWKLKDISIYKDQDKDSRIINNESTREIWLENQEYDMLIRLFDANAFAVAVSELVANLWDIIESAPEEELKPQLVKHDIPSANNQ